MISKAFYLVVILLFLSLISANTLTLYVYAQDQGLSREQIINQSREHYSEGERLYKQGDYTRADQEFKKAQELLDRLEPQGAVIEEKTETKPPQAVVKDKKEAPLTSETEND
ncbi:MAG: hypothetical protein ABIC18_00635, partial [Candidatus Omnitrophota bacterium]